MIRAARVFASVLAGGLLVAGCSHAPQTYDFEPGLRQQIANEQGRVTAWRKESGATTQLSLEEFREKYVSQGDKVYLSMTDALRLAAANNLNLKIADFGPPIAEATWRASLGTFDPIIFAESSNADARQPNTNALAGGAMIRQDVYDYKVGMRKLFASGTGVEVSGGQTRTNTNQDFTDPNPAWTTAETITLTQPLLKNGWFDANLAQVRVNRILADQSLDVLSGSQISVLADVQSAYWKLVFAFEDLRVQQESLQLAKDFYEVTRKKVEAGIAPRIEETKAETEIASRRHDVIVAAAAIRDAQDSLRLLIDPEGNLVADIELHTTDQPVFTEPRLGKVRAIRLALVNRPELAGQKKQIEAQNIVIYRDQNQLLPQLDLQATMRFNGLGDGPTNSAEDANDKLNHDDVLTSLKLEYPLDNRTARNTLMKDNLTKQQLLLQLQLAEYQVLVDVKQAYRSMTTAAQLIATAQVTVRLADEQLKVTNEQYKVGTAILLDVLSAQRDLTEARVNLIRANVGFRLSLVALAKAMGVTTKPDLDPTQPDATFNDGDFLTEPAGADATAPVNESDLMPATLPAPTDKAPAEKAPAPPSAPVEKPAAEKAPVDEKTPAVSNAPAEKPAVEPAPVEKAPADAAK